MIKVKVIGHGLLARYSQKYLEVEEGAMIQELIEQMGIEPELESSLLIIRNGRAALDSDVTKDDDLIELYLLLSGG